MNPMIPQVSSNFSLKTWSIKYNTNIIIALDYEELSELAKELGFSLTDLLYGNHYHFYYEEVIDILEKIRKNDRRNNKNKNNKNKQ